MTTKEQTKIEAVPVFLRPILSMAFWSSVMVGVFPAALSTLLPLAGNCELEGGKPNLFCQMGLVRATFVLESVPWTFYAAVTIIGLIAGLALRWRIALLALAPTALLATITWLEISARTFTPEYPETIQDISWFTDNRAHSRMSSAESWAKMQSPFSTPDTTRLELAYVMLSNEALLLDLELIARRMELRMTINSATLHVHRDRTQGTEEISEFNSALLELANQEIGPSAGRLWQVYGVVALLALMVFLWTKSLRSVEFSLAALAVLGVPFLQHGIGEGINFFDMPLLIVPFIYFITLSFALRLLLIAISQNIDIFYQFGTRVVIFITLRTLTRWWVIVLAAGVGLWLSYTSDTLASRAVYAVGVPFDASTGEFACDPAECGLVRDDANLSIEGDVNLSIDELFRAAEVQLFGALASAVTDANGSAESLRSNIMMRAFDGSDPIFAHRLWQYDASLRPPPSCRWFLPDFRCFMQRSVLRAINRAYDSMRTQQRAKLEVSLGEMANSGSRSVEELAKEVQLQLNDSMTEGKNGVKLIVANVFLTVQVLNLVATCILIVALIKSFVFIFARFALQGEQKRFIGLEEQSGPSSHTPLIDDRIGSQYAFPAKGKSIYYVRRSQEVSNSPDNISCPQPTHALVRRIFSGLLLLNRIESKLDKIPSLQAAQGSEFVEWQLVKGERIYLDHKSLVAFSDTVKLRSKASLRLTSIIFGRMFFLTAEGPGVVVFKTFGKPTAFLAGTSESYSATRLVAWGSASCFGVESKTGLINIYFTGSKLSIGGDGGAVIDVAREQRGLKGAIRFLPACILPF